MHRRYLTLFSCLLFILAGLLTATVAQAQMSAAEHASHHPGGGGAGPGGIGPPAGAGPAGGMGGMMGGMGDMMKNMGAPPPKELYPTLMALPELSPEHRRQVEEQAAERMQTGSVLMGQALDTLNTGAQSGDYALMHGATTQMREGIAQIESGIAARRALAEGRAPHEVALAWFKQEMSLSPVVISTPEEVFGVTPFHLFTMVLLVAFAVAMFVLYFLKMRRAAALFGRIEAGKGPPPPGSAPELAGGKPAASEKPAAAANKPAAE
ncbi:MAG: hypothetical protein ACYC67_27055 [Prosthecobacter sp.]